MNIKAQLTSRVVLQFRHPRGPYGRIAGRIMSTRDTNVARNRWIAEILQPPAGAQILEIGHGPGLAIQALLPRLDGGHVTGLEISELMSRSAARRNKAAVASGRVDFRIGDSADPPADLTEFDLIFAVNATMFWTDPVAAVAELQTRLTPGGEIVFVYMPPPTSTEPAEAVAARTAELFTAAGLVAVEHQDMDYEPKAIATRATRSAAGDETSV